MFALVQDWVQFTSVFSSSNSFFGSTFHFLPSDHCPSKTPHQQLTATAGDRGNPRDEAGMRRMRTTRPRTQETRESWHWKEEILVPWYQSKGRETWGTMYVWCTIVHTCRKTRCTDLEKNEMYRPFYLKQCTNLSERYKTSTFFFL